MFESLSRYAWSRLRSCLGYRPPSLAPVDPAGGVDQIGAGAGECPAFIPLSAFDGKNDPQNWPTRQGVGHSVFNGQIVFTNLSYEVVKGLLAGGLSLAQNTTSIACHPIIHIVGEQTNTGWSWGGGKEHEFNQPYQEFILLVPFVLQEGSRQLHNYVVRMYLTSDIAQILGDLFAYRKLIGQVRFNPDNPTDYRVMPTGGTLAFKSKLLTHRVLGSDAEAESALASYVDIKKIMAMPILGVTPDAKAERYCSQFEWTFNDVSSVAAITTEHSYNPSFDPPRPPQGTLQSAIDGAIAIRGLKWTLAMPPLRCEPA